MNIELTPQSVFAEYNAGLQFCEGIDLYDTVQVNENFFIGKQWEGVQSNGLPTPVFNFLKRVVLFSVANISTDNLKLHAKPLAGDSDTPAWMLETYSDILNDQFAAIFEKNKMGGCIREYCRNAAVDGDGCMYSWWDDTMETGQMSKGGIRTEVLQNTQIMFGNPNSRDVQSQPYIIILRRMLVSEAVRYARRMGASEDDVDAITPDEKENGNIEMDQLGGNKVTVMLRLWRSEETGTIHAYECTQAAELRSEWDMGIKLYPLVWMPWDYVQDCYHGQALIAELIPNQIFVNKLFAMSMLSLMTTAFPKIVYDKTRVPRWDSRVGAAIGINGGDVNNVAKILDPATISPQVSQFIDSAINYTQNFMGASDAALGDTRPDNTSAIVALQRASNAPLELVKLNMYESIEDLGRIYLDHMRVYYGTRYVQVKMLTKDQLNAQPLGMTLPEQDFNAPFDFEILNKIPLSLKLDVGASAYWSEITTVQTLDNLLMQGKIELVDYLERIPEGYVSKRQELIDKLKGNQAMAQMNQGATSSNIVPQTPQAGQIPVNGGSGYGELQRALNETGVA